MGAPLDDRNAVAAGAVQLRDGADGRVLAEVLGERAMATLGRSVLGIPDTTGDGLDELLVAAPKDSVPQLGQGRVALHAGHDLTLLWQRAGLPGDHYGDALALFDDVDGDGLRDLLVGAPAHDTGRPGRVAVLSAADGRELSSHAGRSPDDRFGQAVARVPDVNADGRAEILVGAPEDSGAADRAGRVVLLDGRTGAELRSWQGVAAFDYLGMAVAALPDLDGDGAGEVVLGAPGHDAPAGSGAGLLRVHSGADGRELWRTYGAAADHDLGGVLALAPDVDGDGHPDLLAPSPYAAAGAGVVLLLASATGKPLGRWQGDLPDAAWGHAARLVGHTLFVAAPLHDDGRGTLQRHDL